VPLYLVQHGHSLDKDDDPERGLCDQGIEEVTYVADLARSKGVQVEHIFHSTKKRSVQTAQIFWEELLSSAGSLSLLEGLSPDSEVESLAPTLDAADNHMLVGHLPFMEKLVSFLITGATDKIVVKFQRGGIVCLDQFPDGGDWYIRGTLFPGL
jgi:phosphohistidine phosphatase